MYQSVYITETYIYKIYTKLCFDNCTLNRYLYNIYNITSVYLYTVYYIIKVSLYFIFYYKGTFKHVLLTRLSIFLLKENIIRKYVQHYILILYSL